MNILLDAYLDRNFGDDLFVDTITKMYPADKFYAFMEYYPAEIQEWAAKIPNLYLLPECCVILQKGFFDAYICVGGDIFPDEGDFSTRKEWVESVKAADGKIVFLGFSLFHEYGEKTKEALRQLMANADLVAPRDEKSAEILKEILPEKEISVMADLAFMAKWRAEGERKSRQNNTLGIAVRRPINAEETAFREYCDSLAETADHYLQGDRERRVILLALSDGIVKDSMVAEIVRNSMTEAGRASIIGYQGNLADMQRAIASCDRVICTRFHAMVACVMLHIPFIPINYEVKMEHFLQEIGYVGEKSTFENTEFLKNINWNESKDSRTLLWDEEKLKVYTEKGKTVVEKLTYILRYTASESRYIKQDKTGSDCPARGKLEECQKTIAEYLQTITDCRRTMENYLQTISELQQTNEAYFGQIEELNRVRQLLETELERQGAAFAQERSCLWQDNAERKEEIKRLVQENATVRAELENARQLLEYLRPYFSDNCRGRAMKLVGTAVVKEKAVAKKQWEELENYFLT